MSRMIFVNLPVTDLPRSRAFWEALGFSFNPQFSNEKGACLVIDDNIFAMLLVPDFFKGFTPHPLVDASQATEVLISITAESREAVDNILEKVVANGGREARPPQSENSMHIRSFADPDGHIWEWAYMGESPAM